MVTCVTTAVRWLFVTPTSMLDIRNKKHAVPKSVNDLWICVVMPLTPALLHLVLLKVIILPFKSISKSCLSYYIFCSPMWQSAFSLWPELSEASQQILHQDANKVIKYLVSFLLASVRFNFKCWIFCRPNENVMFRRERQVSCVHSPIHVIIHQIQTV